jgi:hypothetical protein
LFIGQTIKITAGTGFGQERVISSLNDSIIWDSGVATVLPSSVMRPTKNGLLINILDIKLE